jgi:hypothetical protein
LPARLSQPAPQADRLLPSETAAPRPAVRPPATARRRSALLLVGLALAAAVGLTSGLHDRVVGASRR